MATKEIDTRIENKIDTLANWSASNLPLLNGEIAIVRVPAGSNYANLVTNETEPAELLMKIGNGSATFAALPWLSAKAADVYDWAKNEHAKDVPVTITTGTGQDAKTETYTLGAWLKTIYTSNTTQNANILSNTDAINKLNGDSDTVSSVAYTIKAAIDELNSTTSGSGDFVKAVIQTNGKILVTKGTITESDIPELPASKIVITPASSDIAKVTLTNKLAEVDSDISNLSNRLDEVKIQEVYVGDGNMPEDATIQILMDGSNEEQALKDELTNYINAEIEKKQGITDTIFAKKSGRNVLVIDDALPVKHRIKVTTKSINLLDKSSLKNKTITNADGSTLTCDSNGGITGSGTPTARIGYSAIRLDLPINTYTLSASGTFTNIVCVIYVKDTDDNQLKAYTVSDSVKNITFNLEDYPSYSYLTAEIKRQGNNKELSGTAYFQLEAGEEATEYGDYALNSSMLYIYGKNLCSSQQVGPQHTLRIPKGTPITISSDNVIEDGIALTLYDNAGQVLSNVYLTQTNGNRIYNTITLTQDVAKCMWIRSASAATLEPIIKGQIEIGAIPSEYEVYSPERLLLGYTDGAILFEPTHFDSVMTIISPHNTSNFIVEANYKKSVEPFEEIFERLDRLEKVTDLKSWANVQEIVRAGWASKFFSIGDQLVCARTKYGLTSYTLVWDIIGIDQDVPADSTKNHSITLQLHDCLETPLMFDEREPSNPNDEDVMKRGSSKWSQSAIRQWLNSNETAGAWWQPQHEYDNAPNYATTTAGFLSGISEDFLEVVGEVKKTTRLLGSDTTSEETIEKFFLPSLTEVYGGLNSEIAEGEAYQYYADYCSDLSEPGVGKEEHRSKYYNSTVRNWWLRSPGYSDSAYYVSSNGVILTQSAMSSNTYVAPCCCIV